MLACLSREHVAERLGVAHCAVVFDNGLSDKFSVY